MKMNAGTLMTVDTAPRDVNALMSEGLFVHRRLGEALIQQNIVVWANDAEKTAFITAPAEVRAKTLVDKLKEYDAKKNGEAAPAPVSPPTTAPKVENGQNGAAAHSGRTPRTNKGEAVATAANNVGSVVELLAAVKMVQESITKLSKAMESQDHAKEIGELKEMVAASMQIQQVQLGLLCLFGQQVLNAPIDAFLPASISDANTALNLLETLDKETTKKA